MNATILANVKARMEKYIRLGNGVEMEVRPGPDNYHCHVILHDGIYQAGATFDLNMIDYDDQVWNVALQLVRRIADEKYLKRK